MSKKIYFLAGLMGTLLLTGVGCIQLGAPAAGPMGMFRSDDKGENWKPIVAFPTPQGVKNLSGLQVYKVFADPGDPDAFYLGTRGQGLFYTYNNGESWQSVNVLNNQFIYALAVDPTDKCTIYASDGPHIYKTTDCSRSWKLMFSEERPSQRFVSLAVEHSNPKLVYGAILGGDIIASEDGGGSWRVIKQFGFDLQDLQVDSLTPKRLYAASYRNGLFRSDDNGATWKDLSAGLDNFNDSRNFYRLVLRPTQKDIVFWVSKYGILRSNDAGVTWSDLKLLTPPGSVNIYAFAVNPNDEKEMYYTGTILGDKNAHLRSTFYKSVDGGRSWLTKKLPTNTIPVGLRIHPRKSNMLFLGFTVPE